MSRLVPIPPLPGRAPKAPARRNSRDRFGCRHCKTKKKKCDKIKPTCSRCNERGWECIYDPVPSKKTSTSRSIPGGSPSSDLAERTSQVSLGPSTDGNRLGTSDTQSAGSSPASMTFDIAPEPGPYLKYFREHLAPLLVCCEPSNPFVEHILPLSGYDTVLRNAFCMVAAAHQSQAQEPAELEESALYSMVLQGHRSAIQDCSRFCDYNLAVNILFCYFEMIQNSSLSASNLEIHLLGATNTILPGIATKTAATVWLEKCLYYFDVLRSLAYGNKPLTTDQQLHRPVISQTKPIVHTDIDPIFGIATDLWPLLRRVALVVNIKHRLDSFSTPSARLQSGKDKEDVSQASQGLRQELEDKKREIWSSLQGWHAPRVTADPRYSQYFAQLQNSVAHAEAYKAAGLLHLLREVYGLPSTAIQIQSQAMAIIDTCSQVIQSQGPTAGLVWPLFVSALEISDPAGVGKAQTAFSTLYSRRQANNVLVAWRICQEIWNRRSMGIRDVQWKRVAADLGVTVVFG